MAVLELGGGSTQVAFPKQKSIWKAENRNQVHTASYRLGLQAIRNIVFTHNAGDKHELKSICMHPSFQSVNFEWEAQKYKLSGERDANFKACAKLVYKKITKILASVPAKPDLKQVNKFVGTSFFNFRAETVQKIIGMYFISNLVFNYKVLIFVLDHQILFMFI